MKRKTNKDKGFTLVELIVVLVILAILAAILVPALLGYIDRAKEKQYVLNAKSALTATQAELSSIYGEDSHTPKADLASRASVIKNTADVPGAFYIKCELVDDTKTTDGNWNNASTWTAAVSTNHSKYTVSEAVYVEKGYYCVFNGSTWVTYQKEDLPSTVTVDKDGKVTTTGYVKVFD